MKNNIISYTSNLLHNFGESEKNMIESVKTCLYAEDNKIFEKLDFNDDSIYSNPFFFSFLNNSDENILEVLLCCYSQSAEFTIFTNSEGKVYLPKYGEYRLEVENQKVKVYKENDLLIFKDFKQNILKFNKIPTNVSQHGIQFLEYPHPIIKKLFKNSFLVKSHLYEKYFNSAMEIIDTIFPELFKLIIKSVKKVVFFSGSDNSFATLETHGIIFLNVKEEYNEVFFIDDIIHQSAHVIFNTLTLKTKSKLFSASYYKRALAAKNNDSLYGRFHGLFGMCLITPCLTRCLELKMFEGEKKVELIGRLTDNMSKFNRLVKYLDNPQDLAEEGFRWGFLFNKIYKMVLNKNSKIVQDYDVSNQPYVFDYNIFVKTNKKRCYEHRPND